MRPLFLTIVLVFLHMCSVFAAQPTYLSGLALKDASRPDLHENITESKYLSTKDAGVLQIGSRAGFYWTLVAKKKLPSSVYVKVTYQNPNGGDPLINDVVLTPNTEGARLSSPDFVNGLKGAETYTFKLQVFESKESVTPIDELSQNIFSLISN
jgi:hypothetical protein